MSATLQIQVTGQMQGQFPGPATGIDGGPAIDGLGFAYQVESPGGGAVAVGARRHHPVSFIKKIDESTPMFFQALVTNETLDQVDLHFFDDAGANIYVIQLTDGRVKSIRQGLGLSPVAAGNDDLLEEIQLGFSQIVLSSEGHEAIDSANANQ